MSTSLEGKNIVITGASDGIGAALAQQVVEKGAYPILVSRRIRSKYKNIMKGRSPHDYEIFSCDVGKEKDVNNLVAFLRQNFKGRVHGLMNCVGIAGPNKPESNFTFNEIQEIMRTNVVGPLYLTYEIIKMMKENKIPGNIMFLSSIAADTSKSYPGRDPYVLSKASVENATNVIAHTRTLYEQGIVANCCRLPFVEGNRLKRVIDAAAQARNSSEEDIRKVLYDSYPLNNNEFLTNDEMAERVLVEYLRAEQGTKGRMNAKIIGLEGFYSPRRSL